MKRSTKPAAAAKMVTITGGEGKGAPETTANGITAMIQSLITAQLVSKTGILDELDKTLKDRAAITNAKQ